MVLITIVPIQKSGSTNLPLMIEHLPSEEEFKAAAEHIRQVAAEMKIAL